MYKVLKSKILHTDLNIVFLLHIPFCTFVTAGKTDIVLVGKEHLGTLVQTCGGIILASDGDMFTQCTIPRSLCTKIYRKNDKSLI